MLVKNRFGQYLLYATGEIILVIIGILLALQINSWNEQKKIESELLSSLDAMTEELEENIQFLSNGKQSFEVRLVRIKKLRDGKATEKDMRELLNYIGQDFNSKPFDKIFESLKGEKSLKLIKDKELVKKINQFYEYSLTSIDKISEWHQGFVRNNIDPFILENIPSNNGIVDITIARNLMKQLKFKNIINYQSLFYDNYISGCAKAITQAEALKTDINAYLEKE